MPRAPGRFVAPWAPMRTEAERRKDDDARRIDRNPFRKWYKTAGWKSIRSRRLNAEPLCRMCQGEGIIKPATVADHIIPHRGNRKLFFSFDNTQSLCAPHHNRDKQIEERKAIHQPKKQPASLDEWPF